LAVNDSRRDELFIADAKRLLDAAVCDLDAWQTGRLQRARREALAVQSRRRPLIEWAGGIVLATLSIVALTIVFEKRIDEPHAPPILEDLDLISSVEDVELAEDYEFFGWLADPAVSGGRS
jgi:hypothetical protein